MPHPPGPRRVFFLFNPISREITVTNEAPAPVYVATDRYVTIALYSVVSGMSQKAVRRKIEDGKWIEGREYIRSPDGGLFVDREGVARWLRRKT
jgi:hypothetical protein